MSPATDQVVQIAVDPLLDGRPVTTLGNGALVPWTVGIDKDAGYITAAAAQFLGQAVNALPNDGTFAADAAHPEMVLHFSNAASATSPQARGVSGVADFEIAVPEAHYTQLFLALTSSYGDSPLSLTFVYADASLGTVQFTLPDWGTGHALPSDPPIFFNLISGLHKWNRANAAIDSPSHTITGVKLSPEVSKALSAVRVHKGGTAPYLVFWGATGVALGSTEANGGAAGSAGTGGGSAGTGGGSATGGASAGSLDTNGGASGKATGAAGSAQAAGGATSAAAGSTSVAGSGAESNGCRFVTARRTRGGVPSVVWLITLCALLWIRRARSHR